MEVQVQLHAWNGNKSPNDDVLNKNFKEGDLMFTFREPVPEEVANNNEMLKLYVDGIMFSAGWTRGPQYPRDTFMSAVNTDLYDLGILVALCKGTIEVIK